MPRRETTLPSKDVGPKTVDELAAAYGVDSDDGEGDLEFSARDLIADTKAKARKEVSQAKRAAKVAETAAKKERAATLKQMKEKTEAQRQFVRQITEGRDAEAPAAAPCADKEEDFEGMVNQLLGASAADAAPDIDSYLNPQGSPNRPTTPATQTTQALFFSPAASSDRKPTTPQSLPNSPPGAAGSPPQERLGGKRKKPASDDEDGKDSPYASPKAKAKLDEKPAVKREAKPEVKVEKPEGGVNYKVKIEERGAGEKAVSRALEASLHDQSAGGEAKVKVEAAPAVASAVVNQLVVGQEVLKFYWLDAREDGTGYLGTGGHSESGTVYLFGRLLTEDMRADNSNRTTATKSCCIRVRGLQRQVFFLPRETRKGTDEPLPLIEAQREVSKFCSARGIAKRRVDVRERWYAFEEDNVPRDCRKWIKLSYPPTYRELNVTPKRADDVQSSLDTVTHAFGDGRSFLEMLLLKKRLKGPAWLNISNFAMVNPAERVSHCEYEFVVDSYKTMCLMDDWEAAPSPLLKAVSVSLFTELSSRDSVNEIVSAAMAYYWVDPDRSSSDQSVSHCTMIRPPSQGKRLPPPHLLNAVFAQHKMPPPELHPNEPSLLTGLLQRVLQEDPDLIVGHNFLSFDLDVLFHRMHALRIPHWDVLGRMKLRHMPKIQSGAGGTGDATWEERTAIAGRLIVDSYLLAKEHFKSPSYKLRAIALAFKLPGVTPETVDLPPVEDVAAALATPAGVFDLTARTLQKCFLAYSVVTKLQAIQLTKRLTLLAGNLWSRTITGARAERTEYLLLHEFYRQKYILPDRKRPDFAADSKAGEKRKAKYAGGTVLEPKKGLYTDYVLLLDFNSLYPSIIQEFQICFSTVERGAAVKKEPKGDRPADAEEDDDDEVPHVPSDAALICGKCAAAGNVEKGQLCPHKGILPKAIRSLVNDRRRVKGFLARERDPDIRARYDVIQKALKLTANSIYGCLGFQFSRFYAQPLARLVTYQGREALARTIDLVDSMPEQSLSVIYGDTDSVMLNTGIPNNQPIHLATKKAAYVKEVVNRQYTNLEIDIDGVFKSILLVRKKKYAAKIVKDWSTNGREFEQEVKGLDLVRRDWCPYTSEVQTKIVEICLSGEEEETVRGSIIEYLEATGEAVRGTNVELSKFLITKSLTKDPKAYADATSLPHVTIALRMQANKQPVRVGDFIHYVVCTAESCGGDKRVASRAFTEQEVVAKKYSIDKDWYLAQQFHPPISRLCEHIQGLDSHAIANFLGIESSGLVNHSEATAEKTPAEAYLITAGSGSIPASERFPGYELVTECAFCKAKVAVNPHEAILNRLRNWNPAKDLPKSGLLRCTQCARPVNLTKVANEVIRELRTRQRQYFSDRTGFEANYVGDVSDRPSTVVTARHTQEYCEFVRALFSLKEWFSFVLGFVSATDEATLTAILGAPAVGADVGRAVLEKVYSLLTEAEVVQVITLFEYVSSVTRKFARTTVDVGRLFQTVA
eukprot:gene14633-22379_t